MKKIPQETQYHPQGEWRIRRKRSTIPTKVGIRKKIMRYCNYFVKDIVLVICHLVLVGVSCCGYSTRSLLPDYFQKVHVKLFENRTLKPGLDELATNAVTDAFRSGSGLHITDESSADIIIEGKVAGYSKNPHTYTSDQTVTEYKITIKYSIRCIDRIKNEVFWEGTVSDWATFSTDEERATDEAVKKTADKLVDAILTNW